MTAKCKICGQPLTDPTSIALGAGPQCRGASGRMSRRAEARWRKIERGRAYTDRRPFSVLGIICTPIDPDEFGQDWRLDREDSERDQADEWGYQHMSHARLGGWLQRQKQIVIEKERSGLHPSRQTAS